LESNLRCVWNKLPALDHKNNDILGDGMKEIMLCQTTQTGIPEDAQYSSHHSKPCWECDAEQQTKRFIAVKKET